MAGSAPDRDGTRLTRRLDPYVPHVVLRHLVGRPGAAVHTLDATLLFADISGFTKLSERLARRGREGAEELVEAIGTSLSALLGVAHANGGNLLKLSGDALLLLFEGDGHLARASRSALGMRRMLRDVGRLETSAGTVTLRMSQGMHSGEFHLFLVGELASRAAHRRSRGDAGRPMEKAADAGEIVVSPETAALLPADCVGAAKGPGRLLTGSRPPAPPRRCPNAACPTPTSSPPRSRRRCARTSSRSTARPSTATRPRVHALRGHRRAHRRRGARGRGRRACTSWSTTVQRAADEQQVCFLESDVDVDGGKLMLIAGAPRMVGDDEERMLLAHAPHRRGRAAAPGAHRREPRRGVLRRHRDRSTGATTASWATR